MDRMNEITTVTTITAVRGEVGHDFAVLPGRHEG